MQPFGSDRVRADGAKLILSSRYPKGWQPRVEKTMTRSEHPGTAVLWDDAWYEVVAVEPLPQGVRYVLEPWQEHHAMRVTERYDAQSEEQRVAAWRVALAREQKRKALTGTAMFAGHLPAHVQEELASELGVPALRMTNLSLLLNVIVMALLLFVAVGVTMDSGGFPPAWMLALLAFLLLESLARWLVTGTQSRPIGSVIGFLVYLVARPKKAFYTPRGHGTFVREEPLDAQLRDAYTLREPLVTLLSPAEQARITERFGYNYRNHSAMIAWMILIFAGAGALTSLRELRIHTSVPAFVSLLCAGAIALEQIFRLIAFRHGPAGSILAILVRPLTKKLLSAGCPPNS
jgi:hypothetical protein